MSKKQLSYKSSFPVSVEKLFDWHARPGAFERLKPHWEPVELISKTGTIKNGDEVVVKVGIPPVKLKWHLRHEDNRLNENFSDLQVTGPFEYWRHDHKMNKVDDKNSILEDNIELELPFSWISNFFAFPFFKAKLDRLFKFRHQLTKADLQQCSKKETKRMKILISGASGMVGTELKALLDHNSHDVYCLTRSKNTNYENAAKYIYWNPESGEIEKDKLEGFDAVVHLAGENIAAGRWTKKQKQKIRNSRILGTALLSETLANLNAPPKVLVSASAIGFYGDRGEEILDENSPPYAGDYLSNTCVDWERATIPAKEAGIRVVNARIGVVLSPKGGAMAKFLPIFMLGGGGILGSGTQKMSWIALDDVAYAIKFLIETEDIKGPVNLVSPDCVSNASFTSTLGKVINRPTIFPVPALALKLAFGEMADGLLLSSTHVEPWKLEKAGFEFSYPKLEDALKHLLGK